MYTGITGQVRKKAIGRCLLFHINTCVFWIYGFLTFLLAILASSFWFENTVLRFLLSLLLALIAAFTLARIIHALFWQRFRNIWMHNYVVGIFLFAILLTGYALDCRVGRDDALFRLGQRTGMAIVAGLVTYLSNRKKAGQPDR